jgi:tRNA(Ile)-lysidine synthase
LAHHIDDQAETLLLQLLRGAGVRGAAAMSQLTNRTGSIPLVRPLLNCTRQEILDYAAKHDLHWINDESNVDESYPRNFLRHRILPLFSEKFPAYRETLKRSAQHFAEATVLLDDLARLDAPELFPDLSSKGEIGEVRLAVSRLKSLSLIRAKNLLRFYLHEQGAPTPQATQLHDMLRQLIGARNDASVCFSYGGGWQVRRYRDEVFVLRTPNEFDRNFVLAWNGETELDWPALEELLHFKSTRKTRKTGISLAKLQGGQVTLRLRSGGETLRPNLNSARRTLKNLLQEHHMPPWQRDRLPLLFCDDVLVCVPNVAIAAEYQADDHETAIFIQVGGT